ADAGPGGDIGKDEPAIDERPEAEAGERQPAMAVDEGREGEDPTGAVIAAEEEDEALAEFLADIPAHGVRDEVEQGRGAEDERRGNGAQELRHDEEDRQDIDEPERARRIPEAGDEIAADAVPIAIEKCRAERLHGPLDDGPEPVEIGEVQDLAVEIGAPV